MLVVNVLLQFKASCCQETALVVILDSISKLEKSDYLVQKDVLLSKHPSGAIQALWLHVEHYVHEAIFNMP